MWTNPKWMSPPRSSCPNPIWVGKKNLSSVWGKEELPVMSGFMCETLLTFVRGCRMLRIKVDNLDVERRDWAVGPAEKFCH